MASSLKGIQEEPLRKVLIYGDSGVGKTCFASTFPAPIYYFDFDNKVSSVPSYAKQNKDVQDKIDNDLIDYDVYAPRKGVKPGELFYNKLEEFERDINNGDFKYRTIVIDSMTTMVDELLKYLIDMNPGINRTKTNLVTVASLQDYMLLRTYLKNIVTTTLNFPCNVVYTAHIEKVKNEKTGELFNQPMFPGKLARELPIYFEEVYRAYVNKGGVRCAQTKADSEYTIIRSQLHRLPGEIELDYKELVKDR